MAFMEASLETEMLMLCNVHRLSITAVNWHSKAERLSQPLQWLTCSAVTAGDDGHCNLSSREHTTEGLVKRWRAPKVTAIVWPDGKGGDLWGDLLHSPEPSGHGGRHHICRPGLAWAQ